jgi:phage gp29-like protein
MELAPWTAPPGHRVDFSLEKSRPFPSSAPSGRTSRDLPFFDGVSRVDIITPSAIRHAFASAERGYPGAQVSVIRKLIEGDAKATSLFSKRNAAVASKPTVFQPGIGGGANAERGARVFELAMRKLRLREALGHLLQAVPYGYGAAEIEWGTMRDGGRTWVVPVDLILTPADRFRIGVDGMHDRDGKQVRLDELRIYTDIARPSGDDLEAAKWIVLRFGTEALARAGQGRTAAPLMMGKRFGFRDWLVLSERFGIPMPIATYAKDVEDWAKDVARLMIENLGSDGGAVVPEGITLDVKPGVDVSEALQAALIEFCNREMSTLVNGSTDATDSTEGGSYARANVHGDVRFESVADDASRLHGAIDSMLATPFAHFNDVYAAPLMRQQIARDFSPTVLVSLAAQMKNELGIDVSKSQLYGDTGLRPPIDEADKAPGAPKPAKPKTASPEKEDA